MSKRCVAYTYFCLFFFLDYGDPLQADEEAAELQSLEVTVIGTPLSMPPGALFPIPGERHHYHGITEGQPGGSRQANA